MSALHDIVKKGSVDRAVTVRIIDSTDGTPETGVVFNTSGIDLWYRREGSAKTSITEATLAALTTAHADGGFLHIGDGEYRLDLPDAAFATGANHVDFGGTVTGMVVIGGRVRLVDYDMEDSVRLGLTALPNAAAAAAGGIFTRGTGAGQINQDANGRIDVNVAAISTDATAADNAESFFDGTGYAGTNNVIPTVTVVNGLAANVITAAATAADFTTEIQTGLATAAALDAVDNFLDTEIAAIQADTDDIQSRLPAALVGGRMDASVGAMAANVMTAAAAAADLTTELQSGLATAASITALDGKIDTIDNFLDTEIAAIQADTDDIQTRLPAALVSGRMDASVGAMAANVMTAAAAAADLTTELQSGLATAASITSLDAKIDVIDDFLDTEVAAILADTNELQTDWANGGRLDNILDARASQASVDTIDDFLDTEIAAIQADTDDIQTRLPAALVGGRMDASVGAMAANTLTASALATDAVTEIQTGLATAAALDAVDNFVDTEIAAIQSTLTGIVPVSGTIGATGNDTTHLHLSGIAWGDDAPNSMLLTIRDVSTGLYYSRWIEDFADTGDLATVATLPFTPEASVDQYWLIPVRADVTGGSGLDAAGVRAAIGLASANLDTQLSDIDNFLDTEVAAILADTNELQTDWADGGRLDLILDARASQSSVNTIDDFLDTEIAAIQADTDDIQTRLPAALVSGRMDASVGAMAANVMTAAAAAADLTTELQSGLATAASITALDGKIDTIDNFLDTEVAAILADTDDIQTRLPAALVGGRMDASVGAMAANVLTAAATAADFTTEIQTGLATAAALDAVDNFVDTEIAAIQTTLSGIVPVSGTIGATGNDTTHLHLSGIAWANDAPNSMLLTIKDVSTGLFYSRWIEDFVDSSDLATVATLPFTPEASVDQYWLTPIRSDVTGGSGLDAAGVRAAIGLASANLDTQLSTIDDFLDTEIAAIQADTDDIQSRLPAALVSGRMDASVGAMAANVMTAAAAAADLTTELQAGLATAASITSLDGKIDTIDNFLDTEIAAIQADTDDIQARLPAALVSGRMDSSVGAMAANVITAAATAADFTTEVTAGLATAAALDAVDNFVDTEVTAIYDRIGAPAGASIAADIAAISGGGGLDAAGVRAAIGMASANLDTQLSTLQATADTVQGKTDQLTFTKANELDANVQSINGGEVTGDGTVGNEWDGA